MAITTCVRRPMTKAASRAATKNSAHQIQPQSPLLQQAQPLVLILLPLVAMSPAHRPGLLTIPTPTSAPSPGPSKVRVLPKQRFRLQTILENVVCWNQQISSLMTHMDINPQLNMLSTGLALLHHSKKDQHMRCIQQDRGWVQIKVEGQMLDWESMGAPHVSPIHLHLLNTLRDTRRGCRHMYEGVTGLLHTHTLTEIIKKWLIKN